MRVRPRRALRSPLGARVVRVAVPAVAAGALVTAAVVTAGPSTAGSLEAVPGTAPVTASPSALDVSAEALRSVAADRGNRSVARPVLTEADEKALFLEAIQEKAAKERAEKAEKKAEQKAKEAKERAEERDLTVVGSRYSTAAVKLRTKPAKKAAFVDIVDESKKLKVTDTVRKGYRLVVVDGKGRWVTDEYLSKKKPKAEAAGISGGSCSKSSSIESGLVSNGKKVYRAMCAAFPEVSSFGGRRNSNDFHGSGQAVDAMISDSKAGWRLADWLRANASELGVSEVIYAQKIWTVQRSGEGWRGMSNRGSATANHYDHVHVSVY